ncbi:MAG: alpha/beta fold hydrolase, partial [Alphaproteobacteria bacterium]|nr:alpha/beta fold hydrolase [Alphaproteobacteria bacterium]
MSAFLTFGEGAPLLCLHGIGGAAHLWAATAAGLPGHQILAWNQPGYGGTALINPLTFPALADTLAARLDAPQVDLLGHSMGGMIAMEFA